jgi:hypothetical protein
LLGEANDVPARTKPACGFHQTNSTAALKSWNVPGTDSTGTRQGPALSVRDPSHARDCAFGSGLVIVKVLAETEPAAWQRARWP